MLGCVNRSFMESIGLSLCPEASEILSGGFVRYVSTGPRLER